MLLKYKNKNYELFRMDEPHENKTAGIIAIFETFEEDGFYRYEFINYFCDQESETDNTSIALEYIENFLQEKQKEMTQKRLLQVAFNAIIELESTEYEHGAILDYLGISEKEYNYIKKSMED